MCSTNSRGLCKGMRLRLLPTRMSGGNSVQSRETLWNSSSILFCSFFFFSQFLQVRILYPSRASGTLEEIWKKKKKGSGNQGKRLGESRRWKFWDIKIHGFFQSCTLGKKAVSTSPEASLSFQFQYRSPVLGYPRCIVYNQGAHVIAKKVGNQLRIMESTGHFIWALLRSSWPNRVLEWPVAGTAELARMGHHPPQRSIHSKTTHYTVLCTQ